MPRRNKKLKPPKKLRADRMKKSPPQKNKVGIFIDAANTNISLDIVGARMCIQKMLRYIKIYFGSISLATYYTKKEANQIYFQEVIEKAGVSVFQKPIKRIKTSRGIKKKCDLDPEIITDMILNHPKYETLIPLSGDSDFEYPLKKLKGLGKKIVVASVRGQSSEELLKIADEFIDLEEILWRISE